MNTTLPPGVILAGGRGNRIGGEKPARLLAGRPLIAHAIARAAPQVMALAVNGPGDWGLPSLPDAMPGQPGPLAGVLAAMTWAAGLGAARVLTLPCDAPFLPDDLAARLAAPGGLTVARAGRLHPVCAIWPVALADGVRAALTTGEHRVGRVVQALGATEVLFPDEDAFFNVNTPDDLIAAHRRIDAL